jgi:hypothetical protein
MFTTKEKTKHECAESQRRLMFLLTSGGFMLLRSEE